VTTLPYRIIQWGTGNVGLHALRSLAGPLAHYEHVSGRQIHRAALRYYKVMSMLLTPLGP
jgi:hypothetical protein